MAIQGALKVDGAEVFPYGLGIVGSVAPMDDFDRSTKDNRVQARDKETGLPLWQVEVLDFDPEAREKTFRVKIAAAVQPVPPEALPGAPVRPVVLEGLQVMPYIKEVPNPKFGKVPGAPATLPRIGYSLRCTALVAPGRAVKPAAA